MLSSGGVEELGVDDGCGSGRYQRVIWLVVEQ